MTEHDPWPLLFFPAIGILGKTGWLGVLVIFTFFRVICFDYKETLILLIVSPQSSLMIQEQSQEYLRNSIYGAITLEWKLGVPQIACKPYTFCNRILCCPSLLLKWKPQGQENKIWIAVHHFSVEKSLPPCLRKELPTGQNFSAVLWTGGCWSQSGVKAIVTFSLFSGTETRWSLNKSKKNTLW